MRSLRAWTLVLALMCVAALGFGTGSGEEGGVGGTGEQQGPMTITWAPFVERNYRATDDNEILQLIEERFDVIIEPVDYSIQDEEQVQLRLAEGRMPDFFQDFGYWQTLIDQRLVRPVSEEMLRSNMPATVAKLEELLGADEFQKQLYIDGEVWGVPQWSARYENTQRTAIRLDWLENVGIDKIPETLPEFEEMLVAFTFDDPDGNGVDDTYGLSQGWFGFFPTLAAYGVHDGWGYLADDEGRVYNPIITEDYRDALELLHRWYELGVIDPEFVTDDRALHVRKFVEGRLGTLMDGDGWFFPSNANGYIPRLKAANPDAEAAVIMNPRRVDGEHAGMFRAKLMWARGYSKFFGYETSDEKVERIMQILDSFAADFDWWVRAQYGIEGQDYTVADGAIVANADLTMDEMVERGLMSYSNITPLLPQEMRRTMPPGDWEVRSDSLDHERVIRGPGFATTGVNEAEQRYAADLGTIVSEYRVNAIVGDVDIDESWDEYVDRWLDAGGAEVLAEYQDMYDQMYK